MVHPTQPVVPISLLAMRLKLHRPVTDAQQGSIKMVTQVPINAGSIVIVLGDDVPTGDGYRLSFGDTWQGGVFASSDKFSIMAKGSSEFHRSPCLSLRSGSELTPLAKKRPFLHLPDPLKPSLSTEATALKPTLLLP